MQFEISNLEFPKDEVGLLKLFVGLSFFVHLFFLGFGIEVFWDNNRVPIQSEWEIEADLAVGVIGDGKIDSIDRSKKGDEIKVNKQILPQLTKSFEIEKKKAKNIAELGETFADPELEKEKKKKIAAARLKKKEALRRLLKERARKNKKFADETTSPIAKRLQARKRALEGKDFSLGSQKKLNKFVKEVEISVKRFYSLPEVYRSRGASLKTAIVVKLDLTGQILDIKVSETSGDEGFDNMGLNTIKKAAPLPAPPKELVGKFFVLNFNPSN